jgi:hypothetical protein
MQKYLRLMNMRLEVVVRDIVGLTGSSLLKLFKWWAQGRGIGKLRHYNCRKSEEEIAKALQFNGRKDYLFALNKSGTPTNTFSNKSWIQIYKSTNSWRIHRKDDIRNSIPLKKKHKRKNKNAVSQTDMNLIAYQYFEGVDWWRLRGKRRVDYDAYCWNWIRWD